MNPVIGLDVSKGKVKFKAFLDKGKPYRKSFKVSHTNEGLDSLLHFMKEESPYSRQINVLSFFCLL
jgi:transposase